MSSRAAGSVRIIGGRWRSRLVPVASGVRPPPDAVREQVFNILAGRLAGATVADLYAGSGSLGLEALSRGAARVEFVERSRRIAAGLRQAAAGLGAAGSMRVHAADAAGWLKRQPPASFSLAFADPPYAAMAAPGARDLLLALLLRTIAPGGIAYLEGPTVAADGSGRWNIIRSGACGSASWMLLQAPAKAS